MTDRPSIEQQRLADVIRPMFACTESNCDLCEREALAYARTIVAAVNNGTIDPIVPGRKPNLINDAVLGRLRDQLAAQEDELDELRKLRAKIDSLNIFPLASGTVLAYSNLDADREFSNIEELLAWLREASDD